MFRDLATREGSDEKNRFGKREHLSRSEKFAVKLRLKYSGNLDTHVTVRFLAIIISGLFCVPEMSCIISYDCSVYVPLVHTMLLLKQPRVAFSLDFLPPPMLLLCGVLILCSFFIKM